MGKNVCIKEWFYLVFLEEGKLFLVEELGLWGMILGELFRKGYLVVESSGW